MSDNNLQPDMSGTDEDLVVKKLIRVRKIDQPFLTRNLVDYFPYMSLCTEETQKRFAALKARRRK